MPAHAGERGGGVPVKGIWAAHCGLQSRAGKSSAEPRSNTKLGAKKKVFEAKKRFHDI